jgi:hypothetical protein
MTDQGAYWSDWAVAEREHTARGGAGVAPPAVKSRTAATYEWDNCPLVAAAATGDLAWVSELLAAGVDVNEFSSAYEYSALIVAAQKGHAGVVRALLMTAVCDLTKKHMDDYISALDSALNGYTNLEGVEEDFTPEIRAMIVRAHMATADRIDMNTLLRIEAAGAVVPDRITAFRQGGGARIARLYSKADSSDMAAHLCDPPAARMRAVIAAAESAARRITAPKVEAGPKKKTGSSFSYSPRAEAATVVAERYAADVDEMDDQDLHPSQRRQVAEFDPSLDTCYGKMGRRMNY